MGIDLNSISLLLIILFVGLIVLSVHTEIQYRRDLEKLKEIAKKLDEIELP